MKTSLRQLVRLALAGLIAGLVVGGAHAEGSGALPQAEIARRQANIRAYYARLFDSYKDSIVKTTVMPDGQIVDWVPRDPNIATPPPAPAQSGPSSGPHDAGSGPKRGRSVLEEHPELRGPAGTVPRLRFDVEAYLKSVKVPPASIGDMFPAPLIPNSNYNYPGWSLDYWAECQTPYSGNPEYGCSAFINNWNDPAPSYVGGTSTHIIAEIGSQGNTNAPTDTVETGFCQDAQLSSSGTANLCIFTYYSTTGYTTGYYNESSAWHQYSSVYYPGEAMVSNFWSSWGGTQWDTQFSIQDWGGEIWIYVNNSPMGYYSASTFHTSPAGLNGYASVAFFQGEVSTVGQAYNYDFMGSGYFADAGWSYAAYMRQLAVYDAPNELDYLPNGEWPLLGGFVSDPNCYSFAGPYTDGGSGWNNWFYFGGDGAYYSPCTYE